MALGVLISSFPYFGVPTLSKVFGYYVAPSSVQLQRIQISAQTLPVGGNIIVTLVNSAGTSLGASATLLSGTGYVNAAIAAPITVATGGIVRAMITGVDLGVGADLTVNLIGATAEGGGAPTGCGAEVCAPPAAQLLFFKGSVAQEQAAAAESAAAAAASAAAAEVTAAATAAASAISVAAAAASATAAATSATAGAASATSASASSTSASASATTASAAATTATTAAVAAAASATAAAASAAEAAAASKPGALVTLTAASTQTIADATETAVNWDLFQYDDLAFWDISTPSRFTIPAGVTRVRLSAGIRWTANGTGERRLKIRSNGGPYDANSIWASDDRPSDDTGDATASSPIITVTAGMYFEVVVRQDSTGALDLLTTNAAANRGNFFCIETLKT